MRHDGQGGPGPEGEPVADSGPVGEADVAAAPADDAAPAIVAPRPAALWARVSLFTLLLIGAQMTVGTLVGMVAVVVLLASGRELDSVFETLSGDELLLQGTIAATLPTMAVLLGLCVLVRKYLDRRSPWSMGLRRPRQGWIFTLGAGLAAGGLPLAASVGVLALAGGFVGAAIDYSLTTWLLLPTLVVAAFSEEITCRGYLLQTFVDEGRPLGGLFFSSLIFSLLHAMNPAIWSTPLASLNLFGAGVVLALAYLASGNVWFPTLVHFAWNAVQGVLFELPMSGLVADGVIDLEPTGTLPRWLTGGDFGLEGSVLITGVELVLGAVFLVWWRRSSRG